MVKIVSGDRIGRKGKLAVGCSAAVIDGDKILLIRRSDNRKWAVPGGYMEPGENLKEACAREVLEETGLTIEVKRLIGVYSNPNLMLEYDDGHRWQLVILHFEARPISGKLTASNESTAVSFFARNETMDLSMSRLDQIRIADAFSGVEAAIIQDEFTIQ
jgi:ADP-ribose pyrophosphatase YjhB (NUDIX family)